MINYDSRYCASCYASSFIFTSYGHGSNKHIAIRTSQSGERRRLIFRLLMAMAPADGSGDSRWHCVMLTVLAKTANRSVLRDKMHERRQHQSMPAAPRYRVVFAMLACRIRLLMSVKPGVRGRCWPLPSRLISQRSHYAPMMPLFRHGK